jgi:dolichyl-phosphate-mannose-protein mannosyltransferase
MTPAGAAARERYGRLAGLLLVALAVRILGLASPGHGGDLGAFLDWAEGVARSGLGGYYAAGGDANYPPLLYLLWPLGVTLHGSALIGAIRLLSVPFDLGLGVLLFETGRRAGGEQVGLLAAAFYLLNPAVILSGPAWGQVDGIGALAMVGSIVAISAAAPVAAGVLAVVAGLLKPQYGVAAIVIGGLLVATLRGPGGIRRTVLVGIAAVVTFGALLLPLGLGLPQYLGIVSETFARYPAFSQFAFNPWGALFGFGHPDDGWSLAASLLELVAIGLSLLLLRWRRDLTGLLAVAALIGLSLYFIPTRVHERYLFGAIALLAPLAALDVRLRAPFITLSLLWFATLAYVLANSPYRILPGPRIPDLPGWAISAASVVVTLAGAWCAWRLVALFREPGLAVRNGVARGGPRGLSRTPPGVGDTGRTRSREVQPCQISIPLTAASSTTISSPTSTPRATGSCP